MHANGLNNAHFYYIIIKVLGVACSGIIAIFEEYTYNEED